jgi:hypothetical protein
MPSGIPNIGNDFGNADWFPAFAEAMAWQVEQQSVSLPCKFEYRNPKQIQIFE